MLPRHVVISGIVVGVVAALLTRMVEMTTPEPSQFAVAFVEFWLKVNVVPLTIVRVLPLNPHGSLPMFIFQLFVFAQWFVVGALCSYLVVRVRSHAKDVV